MPSEVDVVVLGVGTCGEDLSLRLLHAGLEVAGVEAALVGGECAYWACLPTKMVVRAAGLVEEARRVNGRAGRSEVSPDWGLVARRLRAEVTGGWDDSVAAARFRDRGGRLVHGRGRLSGPGQVTVGDHSFTARRGVVIATGSRPAVPPIPGLESVDFWTSRDVIAAEDLPGSAIVLGGGAVGCELGQVMARFGVSVTILEAADRILPGEEPEASGALEEALRAEGIGVRTGLPARRVVARDGSIAVTLSDWSDLAADRLVVATGRAVDLSDLGLESVGLDGAARRIEVDEHMRAADGVWAMGDVTATAMFTHVALYQSAIVAADVLGEEHPPARYDAVPRVTFTDPEVASVGITEAGARSEGLEVVVVVKQAAATFRGWLHGAGSGVIKIVVERGTGVVLGATVVGPRGGDVLGLFSLAVHTRRTLAELRSMIYAFPTFVGGIGEAIGAYGRGLTTVLDPSYQGVAALDSLAGS